MRRTPCSRPKHPQKVISAVAALRRYRLEIEISTQIGTHPLDHAFAGTIRQDDQGLAAISQRRIHRHNRCVEIARDGRAERDFNALGRIKRQCSVGRAPHTGVTSMCDSGAISAVGSSRWAGSRTDNSIE